MRCSIDLSTSVTASAPDWLVKELDSLSREQGHDRYDFTGIASVKDQYVTVSINGETIELPPNVRLQSMSFIKVTEDRDYSNNWIAETAVTSGELDALVALVEEGPIWDGDVPSKSDRDTLLEKRSSR